MDILELISELEEKIDSSLEIPLIKKAFVNKEELMNLVGDISLQLPDEVRMAKSIAEDRTRILADAQKQADLIIKNAEQKIISMVDEHEITKRANEQANEIIAKAQKNARDIRIGTLEYSDNLLSQLDNTLKAMGESVNKSRSDLRK
ncbi:ATPase [Qingrenia yutianensis]|uniref:ATPase n=1 Tax=Qingrenia yutianensis TaxID=2763676 RepID=A0A926F825_9FIRM|nr:ATPase [Qingrenia yutianensis]MBC8595958.1 ATPase [Qingrenia yutianensis]